MTVLVAQTLLLLLAAYVLGCVAGCMIRRALPAMPGGGPPTALEADGEPAPLSDGGAP